MTLWIKMPSMKETRDKKRGGEVIHVAFGPGGGRIEEAAPPPKGKRGSKKKTEDDAAQAQNGAEPVTDLFSPREVARLLGVTTSRLRSLDKNAVVSPSALRNGRRAYTFQDLIALRATQELLARRVRLRDVAQAIGALRTALPRVTRPLQELRIVSDGRRVVVKADEGTFEPVSGQMVMDFRVTQLREDVVRVLRPETPGTRARNAYDHYMRASTMDEDPSTFDEAERLYQRAIELDPKLAIAYTNLGNVRFRRGDEKGAEEYYRKALTIDARQPEAHYNLGYVMLERGLPARAVEYFEHAIAVDPRFADAHFNLAMAYEALGERAKARLHWKRYLELEPTGTWADIAREHL